MAKLVECVPNVSEGRDRTAVEAIADEIRGVTGVTLADTRETLTGFEVQSEPGRDVRRQLAAAIVNRGWGLLELRPLRMSLEEIFLHLTTEDTAEAPPATEFVPQAEEVAHE